MVSKTFSFNLAGQESVMREPLEGDINIAVNGPFWVEVAYPEHPFTAMLISHSRGPASLPRVWDLSDEPLRNGPGHLDADLMNQMICRPMFWRETLDTT